MNLLDVVLVVIGVCAAVGGYRLGLVAKLISWLGLALGLLLGYAVLPGLLERLEDASQPSLVLVAVATLLGAGLIGQGLALTLGSKLNIEVPTGPARQVDRGVGAVVGCFSVLVGLWLLIPILTSERGWPAEQAYGSSITREVHDWFPEPPDTMKALRWIIGDDAFPLVFGGLQEAPDLAAPPEASGLTESVAETAVRSTVKVQGVACRRVQEGSGFVVQPGLIVTNAHVVAGEDDTQVQLHDGSSRDATVVAYDSRRDIAVLRVDGLDVPPLALRDADVGDVGGVFGHPGGGQLEVSPFEVAEEITAVGNDVYDREESRRQVLVLASNLAPGDSGGALIDPQGDVVGLAFAVAPDKSGVAYALALEEVRAVLSGDLSAERDTGDCLG
ncbi:MAG TPA: MarP family serine protease [Acidimicrobiales bacterium]|nr:MarP family serine protease [Acidimicrobiales bacterium]